VVERRQPDGTLSSPEHFVIHGVFWSPAGMSTESDGGSRRQAFSDWSSVDLPAMEQLGIDTVRVSLDPGTGAAGRAVLDDLYAQGIMAIVPVDDGVRNLAQIVEVVEAFKDHPAVLAWLIGSEWNINYYFGNPECAGIEAAAACTEEAAQLVRSLDSARPVATSYGDIDIDDPGRRLADTERYVNEVVRSVDLWGVNLYRGSNFGSVFDQWRSISGKPIFIGEFGTDVLKMPEGLPDEAMQAHWDLCLWYDLSRELSAFHPDLPSVGGAAFEWNDEWWKVAPAGSHNSGGFQLSGGHPDDFANEEYFGLVDIDRNERLAAQLLSDAFGAHAPVLPQGLVVGVASRGAAAAQYGGQYGYSRFYRCGKAFYNLTGGGGGGRGFNAVVLDPDTGATLAPASHFDTYATRSQCAANDPNAAMYALKSYLDAAPAGSLVLVSVADEAGLTLDNSCTRFSSSTCFTSGLAAIEALGSTQIENYCFRDSWALIAEKGTGATAEGLSSGDAVELHAGLPDPGDFVLEVTKTGSGSGRVASDPAGLDCGTSCVTQNASFSSGSLVALTVTPDTGSWFAGWAGDADCGDGLVWLDGKRSCSATFSSGCGPDTLELRYHVVREPERYQSCGSIQVGRGFRVASAARLDLVSGQRVVFEDDFSVDAGAQLSVVIDPALSP
jgi:hypothetical protein